MKKLTRLVLPLMLAFTFYSAAAQRPIPNPNTTPGKIPLRTPDKILPVKPDLVVLSVSTIAVEDMPATNSVRIRLSVTYKNIGTAAVNSRFDCEVLGFIPTASIGTGVTGIIDVQLDVKSNLPPIAAGDSHTEEWSFVRDKSKLPKGEKQCMIILDHSGRIDESDETNNKSALFAIRIP